MNIFLFKITMPEKVPVLSIQERLAFVLERISEQGLI